MMKIDVNELLKLNPEIDLSKIEQLEKSFNDLKSQGLSGRGYRLALPFSGKRVRVVDTPKTYITRLRNS